jgi:hypothetical protein
LRQRQAYDFEAPKGFDIMDGKTGRAGAPAAMRIAYLCCEETASWSSKRRADAFEHDQSLEIFGPAFLARGLALEEAIWNDPGVDWTDFDGAVIGTVWDYAEQPEAFLKQLEHISSEVPLANQVAAVKWNLDKTYLQELERRGAPTIPTLWCERLADMDLASAYKRLAADKLVIKPVVGASGFDQFVAASGEAPPADHPLWRQKVMVQPFLESIRSEGEISLIFFDGRFSHGLRKTPAAQEYRVQSIYDGREHDFMPSADDLDTAAAIMDALPFTTTYARVDLVRRQDGQLALMECELIEPYLYPNFDDSKGDRFAGAMLDWLGANSVVNSIRY